MKHDKPDTSREDARRLERELPPPSLRTMLMSAVLAGAAVPSSTLARMGIHIPFSVVRLNRFQAAYPIQITQGEAGEALPTWPAARHIPIEESDDDLGLIA